MENRTRMMHLEANIRVSQTMEAAKSLVIGLMLSSPLINRNAMNIYIYIYINF